MKETAGSTPAAPPTLDAAPDVDRVVALWQRGASAIKIARELGLSDKRVRALLRTADVDTTRPATWIGLLSLSEAEATLRVDRHTLAAAAKAGRVRSRGTSNFYGPTTYLFDPDELADDLRRLRCRHPDCRAIALGESRGCEHHGHLYRGARAIGVKRPDIGPKIAAAKVGVSRPDAEERLKSSWKNGGAFARAAIELDWITGATRRLWKLRWAPKPGRPAEWTLEQADEARRLHERGFGYGSIATSMGSGMTRSKVRRMLARQNSA